MISVALCPNLAAKLGLLGREDSCEVRTMSAPTIAGKRRVSLRFTDGQVVVHPEDMDVFVMTAKSAIHACQKQINEEEANQKFIETFLEPVHHWCAARAERLAASFVAVPYGAGLTVFIIGRSGKYDFALSDELSALELDLRDRGWCASVLQIPGGDEDELRAFVNPDTAIQVFNAEAEKASGKG